MAALKRFPNGRAQIAIRANRSATKHLIGPDGHVMCGLAAIWRSQRGGGSARRQVQPVPQGVETCAW